MVLKRVCTIFLFDGRVKVCCEQSRKLFMIHDLILINRIENHAEHGGTLNEHQLNRLVRFHFVFAALVCAMMHLLPLSVI